MFLSQINLVFFFLAVWRVLQAKKNQHAVKEKEPIKIAVYIEAAPLIVLRPPCPLYRVFCSLIEGLRTIVAKTSNLALRPESGTPSMMCAKYTVHTC